MPDEKEVPERISDQALLMLKLRDLASYSSKQQTIPIFPIEDKVETDFIGYRRFNNLCVIDSEFPYAIPNMVLSSDEDSGNILRLTTLQLSMLVPRIRIFKTVFDLRMEQELEIELPFDDVANKDDIENILRTGSGRGSGVGLKSFEWKSMGKNQANLAQFSATLKLFLLNLEEIQLVRNSQILPNGRIINVSVLDLLYQKPDLRSNLNEGSNIYDPKYFGIKVEISWNLDVNMYSLFKEESQKYGEDGERTLAAIVKQKSILYLTLSSHSLDINKDGSVNLDIEYIASAEIYMSNPYSSNILKLSDEEQKKLEALLAKQKDLNKQTAETKNSPKRDVTDYTSFDDGFRYGRGQSAIVEENNSSAETKSLEEQKKEVEEELVALKKNQKASRMASIIERMLKYNLLNVLTIDNESYKRLSRWKTATIENSDDLSLAQRDVEIFNNNTKVGSTNTLDENALETIKSINETGTTNNKTILKFDEFDVGNKSSADSSKNNISFFFLGDLLNIVLEGLFDPLLSKNTNFIDKKVRVLLGPITYYDFGSIEDTGLVMRQKGVKKGNGVVAIYRGKQSVVSIADIPISVREFSKWFIDNVINKARDTYSFLDFSKDLIDDLAISAIAGETFKFAPRQQVRINIFPFSAPLNQYNEDIFSSVINTPDRVDIKSFRLKIGQKNTIISDKTLIPFFNSNLKARRQDYLLFYGTNQPPDRVADQGKDLEQKIYHLFIGEERGLLKNVSFSRDDNPRQRAVNIQQSNPEKQGDGMLIREKYSAEVSMFGNFLFMPGQQVFIHPTYPGLKGQNVRENIFRKLGLGGYYRVIEISNKISSGEFSTNLRTRWDAFGDGTLNIGDQLVSKSSEKEILTGHEDYEMQQSVIDTFAVQVVGE